MASIFVTGSADGLGRAAAGALVDEGHDVVLHARTRERAAVFSDLARRAAATDSLEMGYLTQTWLATSSDAAATVSGGYWYHRQRQEPAPQALDPDFQDQLMDQLAALTGLALL